MKSADISPVQVVSKEKYNRDYGHRLMSADLCEEAEYSLRITIPGSVDEAEFALDYLARICEVRQQRYRLPLRLLFQEHVVVSAHLLSADGEMTDEASLYRMNNEGDVLDSRLLRPSLLRGWSKSKGYITSAIDTSGFQIGQLNRSVDSPLASV